MQNILKDEDTLEIRHEKLCLKFAESCIKDEHFSDWFFQGFSTKNKIKARTGKYEKSAIPYLTRLLNSKIK